MLHCAVSSELIQVRRLQVRRLLLLLASATTLAAPLRAQQSRDTAAAPPLPRNAALVLSGGGARGLAHAGVLLGLEERGYDPPLVVGTSMGAVIGGLYAAGYSAAEIREIVLAQNWADMFTPDPFPVGPDRQPRRSLLSFGLAHPEAAGLEGFVAQASINRRLVQLLFDAGVRARNDFDALPRRFRAVTADLRDGEEVVLAGGDLARAVRASMAVPGVFAPVRWDTLVLVDGGLANNVGTSVARALTGPPVIAVDVLHTLEEIDDVSALGVGLRAVRLLLLNARGGRDTAEAFVLPDIPATFTEASFPADASPLVRAGLTAALAQLSPATTAASSAREAAEPPAVLESLRVEGVTGALADLVRRTFRPALGRYDPARVLTRVDALFATGMFHGVWPRVERTADGAAVLVVRADAVSPVVITGAAHWDSDVGAAAWSALRARPALLGPVELRAALQLDRVERAASASSTWTPGVAAPWSLSAGGYWREHRVRSFDADHELLEEPDVRRAGGWLALEWRRLRPQQALALAFRAERIVAERGEEGTSWGPYLRFGAFPPTSPVLGVENVLQAEWRFGAVEYARVHASGSTSQRWRDLGAALVGDLTTVDGAPPLDALPHLGGLARVPWLRAGELRARATVIGGADVAWPLLPFLTARLRVRSAAAGSTLEALPDARWLAGGEAAVIWQTALAPVSVGVAAGSAPGGAAWRLNLAVGSGW